MISQPKVSFLIINYNGLEHLKQCFKTISKINYPKDKIEIIMVDNGSSDASIEFATNNFNFVKIIKNNTNEGFAKPNNDAAKVATGEYIALLNNDMKIDPEWLNDMLNSLANCNNENYVCVGSKILNWDGSKLDFAGGSISFYGHGYQHDYGLDIDKANEKYKEDKDILFACGGAMLIERKVFLEIGGFDEDYFAYFEDVDLGWRLWILGYKVRFCSKSICYHKHNSTSKKMDRTRVNALFERNSLFTIYKNYAKDKVFNIIAGTLLLKQSSGSNNNDNEGQNQNDSISIAIKNFSAALPKMKVKRDFIQNSRKRTDEEIIDCFFEEPYKKLLLQEIDYNYNQTVQNLAKTLEIESFFGMPRYSLLIICSDVVGRKMAGPAIRYFEMAKQLSQVCNVTLAIPNRIDLDISDLKFKVIEYRIDRPENLINEFNEIDIVLVHGMVLKDIESLTALCKEKIVIVDLYDPYTIENLEIHKNKSLKEREEINEVDLDTLKNQLMVGDYFICANDRQRDLWLGMLSAFNKISPKEYDLSPNLDKLIGIVPFGISDTEPFHKRDVLKDKITNLKDDDKILIWGGGVWNWFDPLTLISAISEIAKSRDDVKLLFLGVKHPNPNIPEMEMTSKSIQLAEELDLKDKYVFFNMDWVDYEDRQNYLLESYAGVSCHFENIETRYSFRTRILDYLWTKLPIISTEGDYFAEEIRKNKLGIVTKYNDIDDMAKAITKLIDDNEFYNECVKNLKKYREKLKWSVVTEPLKEFCINPIKKVNQSFDGNFNYLTDVKQLNKKEILGPLLDGEVIGQKFRCRYPNLSIINIMVGTYARSNNHLIEFKLYEYNKDKLIYDENIDASLLADNAWMSISFSPIINSEGRQFYFTLESKNANANNCISLFKNSESDNTSLTFYNGCLIKGMVCFKTQCILSERPIIESNGIILSDEINYDVEINNTNFESQTEVELLIKKIIENDRRTSVTQKNEIKMVEESLASLNSIVYEINKWKNVMDSRFKMLKGISFIKKIFK